MEMVYMISLLWSPISSFFHGWYTTPMEEVREQSQTRHEERTSGSVFSYTSTLLNKSKCAHQRSGGAAGSPSWTVTRWRGGRTACPRWTCTPRWCTASRLDRRRRPGLLLREEMGREMGYPNPTFLNKWCLFTCNCLLVFIYSFIFSNGFVLVRLWRTRSRNAIGSSACTYHRREYPMSRWAQSEDRLEDHYRWSQATVRVQGHWAWAACYLVKADLGDLQEDSQKTLPLVEHHTRWRNQTVGVVIYYLLTSSLPRPAVISCFVYFSLYCCFKSSWW